jgi:hypothetical protein
MPTAHTFRSIFAWMMGFVALVWIWAVAIIMAWPAEKNPQWEPELRLVAHCANDEACSVPYGQLAEAKAKGVYKSLVPPEPLGEVMEADAWLSWKTAANEPWQYEVKRSSWNFQTTTRYRFDGETPVLVGLNRYDSGILLYALPAAFFSILGLFLRTMRGG